MIAYIFRRLLQLVPVLFGISFITFALMTVIPGDPARVISGQSADPRILKEVREDFLLDRPLLVQYANYVGKIVLHGDMGRSFVKRQKVNEIIFPAFKMTAIITGLAMAIAICFGLIAGILSAFKPRSIFDYLAMSGALVGVSMPIFWLGLMLILLFVSKWPIFPGIGFYGFKPLEGHPHWIMYALLPSIALSTIPMAMLARITRSSMLEVMNSEYITTARAKGLNEWKVALKHGLRNAMVSIVTVIGNYTATLLAGAVMTETVFAWPGLGREIVQAILQRDFPVVMGGILLTAVVFVAVNLIVDIVYAFIDPRIRYAGGEN